MIRPATPNDVPIIVEFIRELADYERSADRAIVTAEQMREALFGPQPAVYAHMACTDAGEPVGFAVWFLNFSTWLGVHGIYLEDLYVRPAARGEGHGKALLAALADIAVRRGYFGVQWWVLKWNTPTIDFYRSIGAVEQDEWAVWRVSGAALRALAGSDVAAQ
ncbi:GNAT family N-acetyltransferase [Rhizocola hellebori]|uniref:GNAT family N-acetyltransferase n=1 Tax=Rhizocola hellebori TaxID=1392758 RepID=UPI001EF29943|nr:GNAT family N-acetyltransferase [Rhizocola hellebori]